MARLNDYITAQDRPIEVNDLLRRNPQTPTPEWECHANCGFAGIMAGDRKLFAAVDVTAGETIEACKAVNGMPKVLEYVRSLEVQMAGMVTLEQVEEAVKADLRDLYQSNGWTLLPGIEDSLASRIVLRLYANQPSSTGAEQTHG